MATCVFSLKGRHNIESPTSLPAITGVSQATVLRLLRVHLLIITRYYLLHVSKPEKREGGIKDAKTRKEKRVRGKFNPKLPHSLSVCAPVSVRRNRIPLSYNEAGV